MTVVPDNVTVLPDGSTVPVVAIAGTVALSTAVSVSNFPSTQAVSGTVTIANPGTSIGGLIERRHDHQFPELAGCLWHNSHKQPAGNTRGDWHSRCGAAVTGGG